MATRRHNQKRRRNRGRFSFLYKMLSVLLIFAAIFAACVVFFRVDTILVEGSERYTWEEIVEASGIRQGDNLLQLNKFRIDQDLRNRLPYISELTIQRKYPDTILITVRESAAIAALKYDGEWWLINDSCKLLERGDVSAAQGLTVLSGLAPLAPAVGTKLTVEVEEQLKLQAVQQMLSAMKSHGLIGSIQDFIHVDDTCVRFSYGDKLTVVMPLAGDFPRLVYALKATLLQEGRENIVGTLDLTYGTDRAHIYPERWTPDDLAAADMPDEPDPPEQPGESAPPAGEPGQGGQLPVTPVEPGVGDDPMVD